MKHLYSLVLLIGIFNIGFAQNTNNDPLSYTIYPLGNVSVYPYANIVGLETPTGNIIGGAPLMDLETGEYAQTTSGWQYVSDQPSDVAYWAIPVNLNQPRLHLAIGGFEHDQNYLIQQDQNLGWGSRYYDRIYVGLYDALGQERRDKSDIYNEDTLFLNELWIAKGAELIHHGPAPLVIKEEFHNYGTFITTNDNLVLEFNQEDGKQSIAENKGTFIGRMEYEFTNHAPPNFVNNNFILSLYDLPDLADTLEVYFEMTGYNEEIQAMVENAYATGNFDAIVAELNEWGESEYNFNLLNEFRFADNYPLKGVRGGFYTGDFIRKYVKYTGDTSQVLMPVLEAGNQEDILEPLGSWNNLFNSPLSIVVNIATGSVLPEFWATNPTAEEIIEQTDTVIYTGEEAFSVVNILYNAWEEGEVFNDSIVYVDTVFWNTPDILQNIQLFEYDPSTSNDQVLSQFPNAQPGDWLNIYELFPETYGRGWSWNSSNTFPTRAAWHDYRTIGAFKNKYYESPNHYQHADTTNNYSLFTSLFPDFNEPYSPAVTDDLTDAEIEYLNSLLDAANVPDNYPIADFINAGDYLDNPYLRAALSGTILTDIDGTTPVASPATVEWVAQNLSGRKTPTIYSVKGTPWLNTDEAYEAMPFHPQANNQELIPNLQPPNTDINGTVIYMPGIPSLSYLYAPNGSLFEYSSWVNCINTQAFTIPDVEEQVVICQGTEFAQEIPAILGFNNTSLELLGNLTTEFMEETFTPEQIEIILESGVGKISMAPVLNPLLGYLDLNKVAEKYFADNPGASMLEFSIPSRQKFAFNPNQNIFAPEYNSLISSASKDNFVRRKYFRLNQGSGNYVVASEFEYWLSLLLIQYITTGGAGMSPEAISTAIAWEDGIISPDENWIYQYLLQADINPLVYTRLSRYVKPGTMMWVTHDLGSESQLYIGNDMAVYDYNLPELDSNYVFGAEGGPWSIMGYNLGASGRQSSDIEEGLDLDYDNFTEYSSNFITWAYTNDTTYFPYLFLNHSFNDGSINGSTRNEESPITTTLLPFVFSDSTNFFPSKLVVEDGPHNEKPMHVVIPRPNANGKWAIEAISYQEKGTRWYDTNIETYVDPNFNNAEIEVDHTDPALVRAVFQFYDSTGVTSVYKYLDEGDRLEIRDADYDLSEWPLHARMYWSSLRGDANGNGSIGSDDFLYILQYLGSCEEDWPGGEFDNPEVDVDGNGCVTTQDLLSVLGAYGAQIGTGYGNFINYPPPVISGTEQDEIETVFEEADPYVEDFVQNEGRSSLDLFGDDIYIFDKALNIIAQGKNYVTIPTLNPTETYLVVSNNGVGKISTTLLSGEPAAYDPGTINFGGTNYTAATGSGSIEVYQSLSTVQDWINMYTNFDYSIAANNVYENVSPRLNQLYYGFNSLSTTGDLYDPANAKVEGLIDIFGAGTANHFKEFNEGVYSDADWNSAARAYENTSGFTAIKIYPPKNIPLAFVSSKKPTGLNSKKTGIGINSDFKPLYSGSIGQYFGQYSELTSILEPGTTVWGLGDVKQHEDYQLHHGVLAMVDMMTIRDYFKLKLHGVSSKFGANTSTYTAIRTEESHGTQVNYTLASEGLQAQVPAKTWAPSICSNYQEWTTNIVAPFFAAHMGQSVTITQDPTPPTQTGIQLNTDANHYRWFENSVIKQAFNTYGPLVYDFNWDGIWNQDDLDIWNGITAYWSTLGDDNTQGIYEPASYYRASTDVLNTVVNTLPTVAKEGDHYEPGILFEEIFDKNTPPYISSQASNWHECLSGASYLNNTTAGPYASTNKFVGSVTLPIFDGNGDILTSLLDQNAPVNSAGAREITDFGPIPAGYLVHPSTTYFPVTNTWQ